MPLAASGGSAGSTKSDDQADSSGEGGAPAPQEQTQSYGSQPVLRLSGDVVAMPVSAAPSDTQPDTQTAAGAASTATTTAATQTGETAGDAALTDTPAAEQQSAGNDHDGENDKKAKKKDAQAQ